MIRKQQVFHSDPDILGGTPVFVGTRVPVRALLDYLEAGDSLDDFLSHFPSVSREQAVGAIELAGEMLTESARTPSLRRTACLVPLPGEMGRRAATAASCDPLSR